MNQNKAIIKMNKRMYRIKDENRMLGGVCSGFAQYLNVDVTLVRIASVVLFFTPIPVFFIYLILWAVLPVTYSSLVTEFSNSEYQTANQNFKPINNMSNHNRNGNMIGGLILIILGAIFSFKTFFDINLFSYMKNLWPLILIGLGVWIIIKDKDDDLNGGNSDVKNPTGTNY
ncbi:PspC domain-containing protein [Lacihabitans lacunae]|uniref:PspC domain-containing protein n=1 Tax=Lacihabitans lacunae TaxID=1028214 RepID=A0ABV7YTC4_9BACT